MAARLVLNGQDIFIDAGIPLPIDFRSIDILEPEKRQSTITKTIFVPSSKETDQALSFIFEINGEIIGNDFNPNKKATAEIYSDDNLQLIGSARLIKISRLFDNEYEYELEVIGMVGDFFEEIATQFLTDLDFSFYDHSYTSTTQRNSWDTELNTLDNGDIPFAYGTGFVYPLIDYGYATDLNRFRVYWQFPAIYLREYFVKIFELAGYTWDSAFLDSDFFKHLIIPFNSDKMILSTEQVDERRFLAIKNTDQDLTITSSNSPFNPYGTNTLVPFQNDSVAPAFDNNGNFNTTLSKWVIQDRGYYNIRAKIISDLILDPVDPAYFNQVFDGIIKIRKKRGSTFYDLNSRFVTFSTRELVSPDTTIPMGGLGGVDILIDNEFLTPGEEITVDVIYRARKNSLYGSDYVDTDTGFQSEPDNTGVEVAGTITWRLKEDSYIYNEVANNQLYEGSDVLLNDCVPQKIKIRDFVISVIRMFNLYFEPSKDDPKKLIIEPRDDYYLNDVEVWTDKVDRSSEMEIIPMGELMHKSYLFNYKPDTDEYNRRYTNTYQRGYGERLIEIDNDFLFDQHQTEIIFSPTPSVGDGKNSRVIPRILAINEQGIIQPKASNIRILYYAGLKSCTDWIQNENAGVEPNVTLDEYPFASHVDDPFNPTLDLNFGAPLELYYRNYFASAVLRYTNNNLYNRYYKTTIEEITDKNSKVVKAKVYLSALDIEKLNFRKSIQIDETYYRLIKVENYDANNDNLCEATLLKIRNAVPFTPTSVDLIGGFEEIDGEEYPLLDSDAAPNENRSDVRNAVVRGKGNFVGDNVKAVSVTGDDNLVHSDTTRIAVLASSGNIILAGCEGVSLINCDGLTIDESNVTYIKNIKYPRTGWAKYIHGGADQSLSIGSNQLLIDRDIVDEDNLPFTDHTFWGLPDGNDNKFYGRTINDDYLLQVQFTVRALDPPSQVRIMVQMGGEITYSHTQFISLDADDLALTFTFTMIANDEMVANGAQINIITDTAIDIGEPSLIVTLNHIT